STIGDDVVGQTSAAVYAQNEMQFTPTLRSQVGLRADVYRFMVDSNDRANSGRATQTILSPKGGVIFGPWRATEFYVNAGLGFHSNDARGATIAEDPIAPASVKRATPLVRATAAEAVMRSVAIPHLQTPLTVWTLDPASALVFSGGAGSVGHLRKPKAVVAPGR